MLLKFILIKKIALNVIQVIPQKIKSIIESEEKIRSSHAHCKKFGSYSLYFEVVYHILSAADNDYMDIQQTINFQILKSFEEENIAFAYRYTNAFNLSKKRYAIERLSTLGLE